MFLALAYLASSFWAADTALQYHLPAEFPLATRLALDVVFGFPISAWLTVFCSAIHGGATILSATAVPIFFNCVIGFIHVALSERRENKKKQDSKDDIKDSKPIAPSSSNFFSLKTLTMFIIAVLVVTLLTPLYMHHYLSKENDSYMTGGSVYADAPMHLTLISSFAHGINSDKPFWKWESPILAKTSLVYSYLIEIQSLALLHGGFDMQMALWVPAVIIVPVTFVLLFEFSYNFSRGKILPAIWSVILVFFAGGTGFIELFQDISAQGKIPHKQDYVHNLAEGRQAFWFALIPHMLLPQRTSMSGFPLYLGALVLAQYGIQYALQAKEALLAKDAERAAQKQEKKSETEEDNSDQPAEKQPQAFEFPASLYFPLTPEKIQRMKIFILAGILAGLLPYCLLHAFVGLAIVCGFLLLAHFEFLWDWVLMAAAAGVVALPQMIGFMSYIANSNSNFMTWAPIWSDAAETVPIFLRSLPVSIQAILFWPSTLGVFFFLSFGGIRVLSQIQRKEYAGFVSLLVFASFFKLQPWIFDNTKVLYLWHFGGAAVAGTALERIRTSGPRIITIPVFLVLFFFATVAGMASIHREFKEHYSLFSRQDRELALWAYDHTPREAMFVTAPTHNHPITCLAGRRTLIGFQGWLWSHGMDYGKQQGEWDTVWKGVDWDTKLEDVLRNNEVRYLVAGPNGYQTKAEIAKWESKFHRVFINGEYSVYEVPQPRPPPTPTPEPTSPPPEVPSPSADESKAEEKTEEKKD